MAENFRQAVEKIQKARDMGDISAKVAVNDICAEVEKLAEGMPKLYVDLPIAFSELAKKQYKACQAFIRKELQ